MHYKIILWYSWLFQIWDRPLAAQTPRDIWGRVPPRGCAKRMQSQRHLKHELGPGKALSFLEPLYLTYRPFQEEIETRYNGDERFKCNALTAT